jgi:DNA-binding response OmpR family regulator
MEPSQPTPQQLADHPAEATPQTQLSAHPLPSPQPESHVAPGSGRKVLCIEDERFIGELYARALGKAGYVVTVISDGREALAAAQTDQYNVILLDLMVPSITGIEILRALRDLAQTPNLHAKVIITTNLEQREDVRADIEKQADGYVVKAELTPRELVAFVDTIK